MSSPFMTLINIPLDYLYLSYILRANTRNCNSCRTQQRRVKAALSHEREDTELKVSQFAKKSMQRSQLNLKVKCKYFVHTSFVILLCYIITSHKPPIHICRGWLRSRNFQSVTSRRIDLTAVADGSWSVTKLVCIVRWKAFNQ